jgi:DUF2924 family protein
MIGGHLKAPCERTHSGASRALRRRLQRLTGELEKDGGSFDPVAVPKIGTTLAREWRGRTHLVLVREDGFQYEGQSYRSLSVIAARITGAHWSGPRFFGLTKRPGRWSAPRPTDDQISPQPPAA